MAWRQLRSTLVGTTAVVLLVSSALAVHGASARRVLARLAQACAGAESERCTALRDQLSGMNSDVLPYLGNLTVTPALIAVVWGAPLISREVETGTAALAWCQSVTRRRWLAIRLTIGVTSLTVLGLVLGSTVTWWLASFTGPGVIDGGVLTLSVQGPLLPALWIAGFVAGTLVGALLPRPVPATGLAAVVALLGAIAVNILTGPSLEVTDTADVLQDLVRRSALPLILSVALAAAVFRQIEKVRV